MNGSPVFVQINWMKWLALQLKISTNLIIQIFFLFSHFLLCAAADPVHGAADEPDPGRAARLRPRPPHGRAGRPAERLEDGPTRLRGHRLRPHHPR